MPSRLKNFLLGNPLHTEQAQHQKLSNTTALAVFSSDAISSVAYATGEIILVLSVAGAAFLHLTWWIALAIAALLVVVAASYRQTIRACPQGGGSYVVSRENLGDFAGLVAGASILVDYTLTVSVSIASGTAAITSAFPDLKAYTVPICLGFIGLLAVANLRGLRESGRMFSVLTYTFVASATAMIVWGIVVVLTKGTAALQVPSSHETIAVTGTMSALLLLRAFASGCAALTGIEAIADGVQAFREPVAKNAAKTMTRLGAILVFLFLGISWLAVNAGVRNVEHETVISQLSRQLFGTGPVYFFISFATMAILVIAANTSFTGFPLLSSFMAGHDFLPHQLKDRGYRLVHSNGILLLTGAAAVLVVVFQGKVSALIPLYAVGVFTAFTLSQAGLVRHWLKNKQDPQWRMALVLNAVGATSTAIVLVVIAVAKFTEGAWIVIILIPIMVSYFMWIRRRYDMVRAELALPEDELVDLNWQAYNRLHNHVILLVKDIDRRLVRALQYTKTLRADTVEAVFVDVEGDQAQAFRKRWDAAGLGVRLNIVESPYREVIGPLLEYIRSFPRPTKDHIVTVIVPEYAPMNVADAVLHDQTSFWIKQQLFGEDGVIVADVPYHPSFDEKERHERTAEKARTADAESRRATASPADGSRQAD